MAKFKRKYRIYEPPPNKPRKAKLYLENINAAIDGDLQRVTRFLRRFKPSNSRRIHKLCTYAQRATIGGSV